MASLIEQLRAEEPLGMLSGCMDTVKLVNPDGPEAADRISALEKALEQWKCGSCGGSGVYKNKYYLADQDEFVEEEIECKVCEGHGLNPIARKALKGDQS